VTVPGQGGSSLHLHKNLLKKPLINNQIRTDKVRLIDNDGTQVGIVTLEEALRRAKERNLDLIQVTGKVNPPVCKIMDYGKYVYRMKKREKKAKKSVDIKGIRLRYNISSHDLETRLHQAEKFLNAGHKVKVEMLLRGREKRLADFARGKTEKFIQDLNAKIPVKQEGKLLKKGKGFVAVLVKES